MGRIFFILTLLGVKHQPIVTSEFVGSIFLLVPAISNQEHLEQADIIADGTYRSLTVMSWELNMLFQPKQNRFKYK